MTNIFLHDKGDKRACSYKSYTTNLLVNFYCITFTQPISLLGFAENILQA